MEKWLTKFEWLNWLRTSEFWQHPVVILIVTFMIYGLVRKFFNAYRDRTQLTSNKVDDLLVNTLDQPLRVLVWILGAFLLFEVLSQHKNFVVLQYRQEVFYFAFFLLFAWTLLRLIAFRERQYLEAEVVTRLDPTTVIALAKLSRLTVVILIGLMSLQILGISVGTLVAFGGIGGAVAALSAKDLLGNFFGGLMIHMDRPFKVGDWIASPDRDLEGTVEYIGWRLTRIRRFDRKPLYVPNGVFTQVVIVNPSRMTNRRIYETIGIRYDDFDKMQVIVTRVHELLVQHHEIDTMRTVMVYFDAFAASSLDFFIYAFTKTTDWPEYHRIKQEILLKVGEIIAAEGAEIAYPTTRIQCQDKGLSGTSHTC